LKYSKSTGGLIYMKKESAKNDTNITKLLLTAGVIAGPLFIVVSLIQALTHQGFDLTRHAISMLLLGNLGWIQFTNFELTGILVVFYAVGIWRLLHSGHDRTWGSMLVGAYGVCLITAGVFPPDPGFGFPPGGPKGMPPAASEHANLHAIAFSALVLSLIMTCFVFASRFAALRRSGWTVYCVVTGVATPGLLVLGIVMMTSAKSGVPLLGVAVVTSAWISVVALRLLAELNLNASI
jgi:Protein of unknown function (DUF998)